MISDSSNARFINAIRAIMNLDPLPHTGIGLTAEDNWLRELYISSSNRTRIARERFLKTCDEAPERSERMKWR